MFSSSSWLTPLIISDKKSCSTSSEIKPSSSSSSSSSLIIISSRIERSLGFSVLKGNIFGNLLVGFFVKEESTCKLVTPCVILFISYSDSSLMISFLGFSIFLSIISTNFDFFIVDISMLPCTVFSLAPQSFSINFFG